MPIRRKRPVVTKGAEQSAPSGQTGGIKKRTSLPPPEEDIPQFEGELGNVIQKMTASGTYGKPFIKASSKRMDTGRTRTGILAVDLALGGGWTLSRAGMLYGEKSTGKSTMALQSIATIQRDNPDAMAAWIDIEGTLDKSWARKLGVDLDRLVVVNPETGEHAVDLADAMLRAREVKAVVTDSIAMLIPMKELEESAEQETMALQARLVGKYIRKTNNALLRERGRGHLPILIHINQFRMKVGLVFGDPRTLPGGKALEFSTSQQIEVKNKEKLGKDDDGNEVVQYNEHNIKITKNKSGGPMKEAAYKLVRLEGFEDMPEAWVDQAKTIHSMGSQVGVVSGTSGSFEVDGIGKFRGAPAFTKWALENPVPYHRLQQQIIDGFRKRWALD
jgi:recombination protein RecA